MIPISLKGMNWRRIMIKITSDHSYGVLCHFQQYFSLMMIPWRQLTLFMSFLGFTSTRLVLCSVLPMDIPTEKKKKKTADPSRLEPKPWYTS